MTLRTQLAYAAAGLALVLGLLSLLNPYVAIRLLGLDVVSPRGLSEVRSMYGALHVTMAALMLWAIPLRPRTSPLLRTLGVLWLGAAAGRVASLLIDADVIGPVNFLFLLLQLVIGGALVWASLESTASRLEARARLDRRRERRKADEGRVQGER
ncbi:hypothetical protein BH23DEI1_BH23DEI1_16140 [soil metagenome]|nr:DUF4345 family protein [Trueperaceae bacterium]